MTFYVRLIAVIVYSGTKQSALYSVYRKRATIEECYENRWMLPSEYMLRKREACVFKSEKLTKFAQSYERAKRNRDNACQMLSSFGLNRYVSLANSLSLPKSFLAIKFCIMMNHPRAQKGVRCLQSITLTVRQCVRLWFFGGFQRSI